MRDISIRMPGEHGLGSAVITVGGTEIQDAVTAFHLNHKRFGDIPTVVFEMLGLPIRIEIEKANVQIDVPDHIKAALLACGWTPPDKQPVDVRSLFAPGADYDEIDLAPRCNTHHHGARCNLIAGHTEDHQYTLGTVPEEE